MWNIYAQKYMFIPYFKIYTNVHSLRLMKVYYFANVWIYIYIHTHIYINIHNDIHLKTDLYICQVRSQPR